MHQISVSHRRGLRWGSLQRSPTHGFKGGPPGKGLGKRRAEGRGGGMGMEGRGGGKGGDLLHGLKGGSPAYSSVRVTY